MSRVSVQVRVSVCLSEGVVSIDRLSVCLSVFSACVSLCTSSLNMLRLLPLFFLFIHLASNHSYENVEIVAGPRQRVCF